MREHAAWEEASEAHAPASLHRCDIKKSVIRLGGCDKIAKFAVLTHHYREMKKTISAALVALALCACGRGSGNGLDLPKDFDSRGDAAKVEYLMEAVSPDSVAVLIIKASLGEIPNLKIDTLSVATLYAYENYKDEKLTQFSNAFDNYQTSLPLDKKMLVYKKAGEEDPAGLGYRLGLEYVGKIRENNISVKDIDAELAAFRKACGSDPDTYRRFVKGFKTALEVDKGKGIPAEVYSKYINMPES